METMTDFILGGPKITADGDYSHETKTHLLLGRKATKLHLVKAMVFPVVMYGCEGLGFEASSQAKERKRKRWSIRGLR